MILHNDRPEDLETPVRYFDSWLTPTDAFFVRQHIPRPAPIDAAAYRLTVNGMVAKPLELTLADLQKLPQATVPATIECTGNGRASTLPRCRASNGAAERSATPSGPARASRDILKAAGASPSAAFLETDGADTGVAKTPDFVRSLPMKKAMHPATILALKMNGQAIPDIHGFPARLIVPGWDGTSSVKWVVRLSAAAEANTGFFMNPGYRYPKYALPPGSPPKPAELEVIEGMPVKSSITSPEDQGKLALGDITIRGFAWAGEESIERVEVSTDGGSRWRDAATFDAQAAVRLAAVASGLAAGGSGLLHDSVACDRFARARAAHRRGVEPVGVSVERDRSRRRDRGEGMMTARLLWLAGAAAGAALCADPAVLARGQKEEARSCIPCHSLRLIHSQRLSSATWSKELDKMAGWGTPIADRDALLEYLVANFGDDKAPPAPAMSQDGVKK